MSNVILEKRLQPWVSLAHYIIFSLLYGDNVLPKASKKDMA
jgi:hypothetical protein